MDNIKINYSIFNKFLLDREIIIKKEKINIIDKYYIEDDLFNTENKNILINNKIYDKILKELLSIKESKILGCSSNICIVKYKEEIKNYYLDNIKTLLDFILNLYN